MSMENMTDKLIDYEVSDPFCDEMCPVCGSYDIYDSDCEIENDNYYRRMYCVACDSEWTHTFWIANTLITKDGRFEEE